MEFVQLTKEEFNAFSEAHPLGNFHQSSNWGVVKSSNGWGYDFVGVKENGTILAACLLLHKTAVRVFKFYYSPRGFLIDFYDDALLEFFTRGIVDFVKKNNGIFLKVDPYVDEKELDLDGNVVEGGYDNSSIKNRMKKLGYTYLTRKDGSAKTTMIHTIFVLPFEGRSIEEIESLYHKHVKNSIKTGLKNAIEIEELTYDQLPRFKAILEKTSVRRGFVDRSLAYYQTMYNAFAKEGKMVYRMAVMAVDKYKESIQQRLDKAQATYDIVYAQKMEKPEVTKFDGQLKEATVNLDKSRQLMGDVENLIANYGHRIDLSCACYFLWGNEILNLYGGNEEELLDFGGQYVLHADMIRKAVSEGYSRYNFYGIGDNLNKEDPMYGVYEIKRGFHGKVVRLLGEFD